MKKAMRSILTMAAIMMLSIAAIAQTTVKGVVVDGGANESLPGASIVVPGTTSGTVSGFDGSFALQLPEGTSKVVVSFVGFLDKEIALTGTQDLGNIVLESDAVGLVEVSVMASVVTDRQTPVSVSTISPEIIQEISERSYGYHRKFCFFYCSEYYLLHCPSLESMRTIP